MSLGADVIEAVPVTVERFPAPAVVAGRAEQGPAVLVTVRAQIQPATGRDLLLLEEGMRTRETVAVFALDKIRTLDDATGTPADIIRHAGERYQVKTVHDWYTSGGFYKGVAVKVPR